MNRRAINEARKWVFSALIHDLSTLSWILGHPVGDEDIERLSSTHEALLRLLEYRCHFSRD